MDLSGKVALVTGASKGIGRATAIEFAKAGADILINYIGREDIAEEVRQQVESYGVKALTYHADVSHANEVQGMFSYLDQELGSIDILVNNAGFAKGASITDMSDELWNQMIRVHLYGVFYNSREAVKRMKPKKVGKIINIASDLGQLGCEEFTHYSAAKGGIISFTKALARELAPEILVNAVAPSGTMTDILIPFGENYVEEESEKYPLKRLAQPEEIAKSVLFLASDYANFYTGQVLGPNGGVVMNG